MPIVDRNNHLQIVNHLQRYLWDAGQQTHDGSVTSSDTCNGDAGINHLLGIGDELCFGIRRRPGWCCRQPPI